MAGSLWQYGVNIPLINQKFAEYDQKAFFLNDEEVPTSTADIETADEDGAALDVRADPYNVSGGNVVILGPSTHADNLTAIEEMTVSTTDATSILGSVHYKYMATDPITIRTIPRGWTAEATAVTDKVYSRVDGVGYGDGGLTLGTGYGCKIFRDHVGGEVTHYIEYTTPVNSVDWNEVPNYRASYYGISEFESGNECRLLVTQIDSAGTDIASDSTYVSTATSSYTLETSGTKQLQDYVTSLKMQFIVYNTNSDTAFTVALPILEHAANTSDASSGIYTVTKNPRLTSVRPNIITGEKNENTHQNQAWKFDASGGRVRWMVPATFRNITFAQYQNLMVLKEWNLKGYKIVFRPDMDILPPVMIGDLYLSLPYYEDPVMGTTWLNVQFVETG